MKIRIREGNDFDVVWAITRAGQPEDLSTATSMKLTLVVYGLVIEHSLFTVTNNMLSINIPKEVATTKGDYRLIFEYTLPDAGQPDGDLKCKTDVVPFRIVPFTADADNVYTVNTSSDVLLGFKGDKGDDGDDAYQIWLDLGNVGTYEDFIAYLRQPAVDAGTSISELEGEIQVSESLRVAAETARANAEGDETKGRVKEENERAAAEIIRQSNEGNRIENEATRVQYEAERISKENVRQNSEVDRIGAEDVRDQAESERAAAETARANAEGDATKGRVKAENERVTAESERAAAETARANAEGDATKGRVKAENERVTAEGERAQAFAQMMGEADDKIEEMDTTLSTYDGRVTQVESDITQLAGDTSVKIKNLAVNGDFANGTTGWRASTYSSISATAEGTLKVNMTGTNTVAYGAVTTVAGVGLKYVRARFKPSVNVSSIILGNSSTPVNILANVWSTISRLSNESTSFRFYMELPPGENYELDDVVVVNLPDIFGAGNEPTLSEMDLLIGILGVDYFDGEITIPAQKVMQWQLKMIRQNRNAIVALGGTII